jgi:hypothetical protein
MKSEAEDAGKVDGFWRKRDLNEIGCLWTKRTQYGNEFYTGTIAGQSVMIFRNRGKKSAESPDWLVLKREPRPAQVDLVAQRREQRRARQRARLNAIAEQGRAATNFAPRLVKRQE